jgi:hypothetical protein
MSCWECRIQYSLLEAESVPIVAVKNCPQGEDLPDFEPSLNGVMT